ncbi:SHOCT domain-containing protein [Brevibacillus centrosporus]|uniref:SHOCT domain-containing protein n=1 Tax=Brevibacillus centrosporus TaxID=54910 RepID=UPI003986E89F
MSESIFEAQGVNGSLIIYPNRILISRQSSFLAKSSRLYDKEITIKSVSAIQLKEPSMFLNGFIQFSFSGGKESKGGAFDAAKDENSIVINKKQLDSFKKAKDIIYDLMSNADSSAQQEAAASDDSLDQLEKLAALRDKNIISEEEFNAKKKQILGI